MVLYVEYVTWLNFSPYSNTSIITLNTSMNPTLTLIIDDFPMYLVHEYVININALSSNYKV